MSKVYVKHVVAALDKLFSGQIDLTDYREHPPEETRRSFLTRALAAYSLHVLAEAPIDVASASVVDGFNDLGIDALNFDQGRKLLWIVQSKWYAKGTGEPATADLMKFREGIKRLYELELDDANEKLRRKEPEIIAALHDSSVRHRYVLAYTGTALTRHNKRIFDSFLREVNQVASDQARLEVFCFPAIHNSLLTAVQGEPFNAEVGLMNWGKFDGPYTAYYGHVCGADVARWWEARRNRLFTENIRAFLGSTAVNRAIRDTVTNQPEQLWYFNNGVTILCQQIRKSAVYGNNRTAGLFDCRDMSIVNGIQTVATIGEAFLQNPASVDKVQLFIKLISLEDCPKEFGRMVTKATNTQNVVVAEDFVSLCPQQDRLRTELLLQGKYYQIQRSDAAETDDNRCNLREAAVALACEHSDVRFALAARANMDSYWDVGGDHYKSIFNSTLSGSKLWRAVVVFRELKRRLERLSVGDPIEKTVFTYGNLVSAHVVFRRLDNRVLHDEFFDFDEFREQELAKILDAAISDIVRAHRFRTKGRAILHSPRDFAIPFAVEELRSTILEGRAELKGKSRNRRRRSPTTKRRHTRDGS